MPTYEFWYSEIDTYKAWFEADSEEEALALLKKVQDGEHIGDLPNFDSSAKEFEVEIDTASLKKLENYNG